MGANDGGIDHLDAVGASAGLVQRLQYHVPDPRLRPAPELAIDRVPGAEMAVQITPCGPCSGDPEYPIEHQSMITRPPTSPRTPLDYERLEKGPLLIRHQTSNQHRSPQRTALNQRSADLGILFVHTT